MFSYAFLPKNIYQKSLMSKIEILGMSEAEIETLIK